MVAPLLEVLLLRVLRRRADAEAASGAVPALPTRLVSAAHRVDTVGYVAERTSVLLQREGAPVEVLSAGSLVLPPLLPRTRASYAVLTHEPVDVRLRLGPFDTLDARTVHQVELLLGVALVDAPSALHDLVDTDARLRDAAGDGGPPRPGAPGGPDTLDGLGERLLDRLARELSARTTDAVRRRTLADLTDLSLGVVLDESLPHVLLGGALGRTALEVVDVDWPTEGHGRPAVPAALPGGALTLPVRPAATP
ncbi:hypothetical protein SAMN04488544_0788 [Microlunatus sagamiharensis]|uniref:Uncharacterized protein n=1 Tax=Microlunatus sagamiharensis TaxID=546874 RepID=A0A1H2LTC0_9ACTN|nr:hypothetical protein [Microlunatus sagamiharensis]SDU84102.1 hypothetical protein SAMN04488544_0788 [Microlunatus sagamiharensis]